MTTDPKAVRAAWERTQRDRRRFIALRQLAKRAFDAGMPARGHAAMAAARRYLPVVDANLFFCDNGG